MPTQSAPIVSQWYRHRDKGYQFQVVAVDADEATVEIQHFDGDVEELDMDGWYELEVEPIEPPADWTGPIDDIERDDLGYSETGMSASDWSEPLEESGKERREQDREEKKEE